MDVILTDSLEIKNDDTDELELKTDQPQSPIERPGAPSPPPIDILIQQHYTDSEEEEDSGNTGYLSAVR